MIILAARPSMGKTALALNFLVNAAFKERRTVAIFSVEMPAEQLMQRLIASRSGVDGKKIRKGEMTDRESMKVDSAMNELSSIKLFIDDKTSTMADIGVKARKLKSTHDDLSLIVIDYLQLAKMGGNKKFDGEQAEVSEIYLRRGGNIERRNEFDSYSHYGNYRCCHSNIDNTDINKHSFAYNVQGAQTQYKAYA
jgi:replicative DNA helicase